MESGFNASLPLRFQSEGQHRREEDEMMSEDQEENTYGNARIARTHEKKRCWYCCGRHRGPWYTNWRIWVWSFLALCVLAVAIFALVALCIACNQPPVKAYFWEVKDNIRSVCGDLGYEQKAKRSEEKRIENFPVRLDSKLNAQRQMIEETFRFGEVTTESGDRVPYCQVSWTANTKKIHMTVEARQRIAGTDTFANGYSNEKAFDVLKQFPSKGDANQYAL